MSYIAVLRRQLLQEGSGAEPDPVGGRSRLRRAGAEARRDLGMSHGREKHKQILKSAWGIKLRCFRLLKCVFHLGAGGAGLRVPPVDGTCRAEGE